MVYPHPLNTSRRGNLLTLAWLQQRHLFSNPPSLLEGRKAVCISCCPTLPGDCCRCWNTVRVHNTTFASQDVFSYRMYFCLVRPDSRKWPMFRLSCVSPKFLHRACTFTPLEWFLSEARLCVCVCVKIPYYMHLYLKPKLSISVMQSKFWIKALELVFPALHSHVAPSATLVDPARVDFGSVIAFRVLWKDFI